MLKKNEKFQQKSGLNIYIFCEVPNKMFTVFWHFDTINHVFFVLLMQAEAVQLV